MFNLALLTGRNLASPGPAASAFLARTSGLSTASTQLYTKLINGLVSDGVWSKLDVLYFFAAPDSTTATLNLVSSSFTAIPNGATAFVASQGYTGVAASSTAYIDTQFNPSTAGGNYTQNSAHLSVWINTAIAVNANLAMANHTASGTNCGIYPKFTDNKSYWRINDNSTGSTGVTNAGTTNAYFLANRSSASTQQGYNNGVDQGVTSVTSSALTNCNMMVLGDLQAAGAHSAGYGAQASCASIGGNLSATDVTNLYNRLVTARTTVGLS